jgi:hypothetical protein
MRPLPPLLTVLTLLCSAAVPALTHAPARPWSLAVWLLASPVEGNQRGSWCQAVISTLVMARDVLPTALSATVNRSRSAAPSSFQDAQLAEASSVGIDRSLLCGVRPCGSQSMRFRGTQI